MFYKMYKLVRFCCSLVWYGVLAVFGWRAGLSLGCVRACACAPIWIMGCASECHGGIFPVSSYPVGDWRLWLICFNETSIVNCSLVGRSGTVLRDRGRAGRGSEGHGRAGRGWGPCARVLLWLRWLGGRRGGGARSGRFSKKKSRRFRI